MYCNSLQSLIKLHLYLSVAILLLQIVFTQLLFPLKIRQVRVNLFTAELQCHHLKGSADYHPTLKMTVTSIQESKNSSDLFFLA